MSYYRRRVIRYSHSWECGYCYQLNRATADSVEFARQSGRGVWACDRCGHHHSYEHLKPDVHQKVVVEHKKSGAEKPFKPGEFSLAPSLRKLLPRPAPVPE